MPDIWIEFKTFPEMTNNFQKFGWHWTKNSRALAESIDEYMMNYYKLNKVKISNEFSQYPIENLQVQNI